MSRRLPSWVFVPACCCCCAAGLAIKPGPWPWASPPGPIGPLSPPPSASEAEVLALYEQAGRDFRAALRARPLREHDGLVEGQIMLYGRLICSNATAVERRVAERVLRAALAAETVRRVQAALRFDLAVLLKRRSEVGPRQPLELSRRLSDESLDLFRGLLADYPETTTFAPDRARIERRSIAELAELAVGRAAPDLLGEGLDGRPARLSDDRGRVVLIYLWSYRGSLYLQSYPEERALLARLEGRPFAMIGLGSGRERTALDSFLRAARPPWRTVLYDVDGRDAPLSPAWQASPWPAVFLIDHRGVIRFKRVFEHADPADLDDAIDLLLAERDAEPDGRAARRVDAADNR